jgi:hypothetical protein
MLGDRATKNFRGQIRARDQKHNLGIGVIGWGLKECRRRPRTGSLRRTSEPLASHARLPLKAAPVKLLEKSY